MIPVSVLQDYSKLLSIHHSTHTQSDIKSGKIMYATVTTLKFYTTVLK